eukprot:403337650
MMQMNTHETFYAKFQSIAEASVFVKYLPCLIGGESVLKTRVQQSNGGNPQSQNFAINLEDPEYQKCEPKTRELLKNDEVKYKLHLSSCSSIYNVDREIYEMMALKPFSLNDKELFIEDGYTQVNSMDKVYIPCNKCYIPHLFYFILPLRETITQQFKEGALAQSKNMSSNAQAASIDEKLGQMMKKIPDKALQQKWGSMEKETLKKYLLQFGYGRWRKIRKYSKNHDKILKDKSDLEMKAFSNDFIRTLFEFLQNEKNELKNFLINLIDERPEDPFVQSQPKEWGEQISQRAAPWAKRIQLLHRVKGLIETYKSEKKKYFAKSNEDQDPQIKRDYETWDNLLNFLPASVFYGQRPSVWWTLRHDIDLLFGTYKYGYAMYQAMRNDKTLSFHKSEQVEGQYQEFPNADNITRRLKKLVQIIGKSEYQQGLSFEKAMNAQEPTGFTLDEKNMIYEILINVGVPVNSEGKNDYGFIRNKLVKPDEEGVQNQAQPEEIKQQQDQPMADTTNMQLTAIDDQNKEGERNTAQNLERFIQRLRMVSQQIIQSHQQMNAQQSQIEEEKVNLIKQEQDEDLNEESKQLEEKKKFEQQEKQPISTKSRIINFDPDEDGFNFGYEKACIIHKNMNILQFIRKNLLLGNGRQFETGLEALQEQFIKDRNQNEQMADIDENTVNNEEKLAQILPENWSCERHDRGVLTAVNTSGFEALQTLSGNKDFGFEDLEISPDLAFKRVEEICEFYKEFQQQSRVVKKPKKETANAPAQSAQQTIKQEQVQQQMGSNESGQITQQITNAEPRKKVAKVQVQKDEEGCIIYPIVINSSLQILDLGLIEYERNQYHTEKNLFPIGFKSQREHNSQLRVGERCQYICEILDGGQKPLYRVTPMDDPENSITRESSTGCWIDICKKINELQGNKRSTVTVSGPERFGLADINVIKLMQQLPNATRCQRYQLRADL